MRSYAQILLAGGLVSGCTTEIPFQVEFLVGDGSILLEEDSSATLELIAEANASPIQYEIRDQPTLGRLIGSGSQWEYVPRPDLNGVDTFTWVATFDGEESDLATVTIEIQPVNDGPRGETDVFATFEDTELMAQVEARDIEGDELTYVLVNPPEFGRVNLAIDGSFTYTPNPDFVGDDNFLWSATDTSDVSTGPVRADVNVRSRNDAPSLLNSSFTVTEDVPFNGQLLGVDADGDDLTWRIEEDPANGSLDFNGALGTFTYTPNLDFFGLDTFVVVARDGFADSEPTTVELNVVPVNDRPVVNATTLETLEDEIYTDTVDASDAENSPLSFAIDQQPTKGNLSIVASTGVFIYTPFEDVTGLDDFTIIANDGTVDSLPGRYVIDIIEVNDPPRLSTIGLWTTPEDTAVTGSVSGTDPENQPLQFSIVQLPSNGSISLSEAQGTFAYVPDENFNGTDVFTMTATDGEITAPEVTLQIVVTPVNDAPIITPVELITVANQPAEVQLLADDPEGDTLFYAITTPPANGSALINGATGLISYEPDPGFTGSDLIRYTVTDPGASSDGILPITVSEDRDNDGIADQDDNCPLVANPDQEDVSNTPDSEIGLPNPASPGNGIGDVCDCYDVPVTADLDNELFASVSNVTAVTSPVTSDFHALRFDGDGAFVQSVPLPGCASIKFSAQLATTTPAPGVNDSITFSLRRDGGPWISFADVFGTGSEISFSELSGQTGDFIDLRDSTVEFLIEVSADSATDFFILDDIRLACDEDQDGLEDCVERTLEGYDLLDPNADGDGWDDSIELDNGTDPNNPDTDFDGVDDDMDNCPLIPNPPAVPGGPQDDTDGNGIGDACEAFGFFDDFEATGLTLDPNFWATTIGQVMVEAPGPQYAFGTYSLMLDGPVNGTSGRIETAPYDFSTCTDAIVQFDLINRDSDFGDDLWVDYWQNGAWVRAGTVLGSIAKNQWFYYAFPINEPGGFGTDFMVKLENESISWNDRFYIDNIAVDCDTDADLLANVLEQQIGTNPFNPDTDGDGIIDGTEFANGTDPLNP